MKALVWVDWSDEGHPVIRNAKSAPEGTVVMTLAEARGEIVNHFNSLIKHAEQIIRRTRAVQAVPAD